MVFISNAQFGEVWQEREESAVELRMDTWCKCTRGLPPYEGFIMVRFCFQDAGEEVEWLGLCYPLWRGSGVTYEECVQRSGVGKWSGEGRKWVLVWALMTLRVLEGCMRAGKLSAEVRELLEATPVEVRTLQLGYDMAEGRCESVSAYAARHGLEPEREGSRVVNYADYRGLSDGEFLAAVLRGSAK